MQTHEDNSHQSTFIDRLRERAESSHGVSKIAAGDDKETPIVRWVASNRVHCQRLPDDEQGILRISCGGGENIPVTMNYVSIRGGVGECIALLEKVLTALKECPE